MFQGDKVALRPGHYGPMVLWHVVPEKGKPSDSEGGKCAG